MVYYIIRRASEAVASIRGFVLSAAQLALKQKAVLTVTKRDMTKIEQMKSIFQPNVSVSNAECEESQSCILFA